MIFTTCAEALRLEDGAVLVLPADLSGSADPAVASDGFAVDDLACFLAGPDDLVAGSRWTVAARRSMARHGASALDTEVTVRLLVPADSHQETTTAMNAAMTRLALALAG